jgi:hypothetical protein
VVVKRSWSIASLTRGSLSSDTPPSDHLVTNRPDQPDRDEKRSLEAARGRVLQPAGGVNGILR